LRPNPHPRPGAPHYLGHVQLPDGRRVLLTAWLRSGGDDGPVIEIQAQLR
jgi:hypothetical protein